MALARLTCLLRNLLHKHREERHTDSLDSISAVGYGSPNLTGRGDTERLNGTRVSAKLFQTLGVNAAVGRTLESEDDRPGVPNVVVITYGLWLRRFGGDASLIGQPLELNGASYTLVGALPPNFFFSTPDAELGVPLVPDADPWRQNRNTVNFLRLVGRIRQGVAPARAEGEMNALARKLREQLPEPNARKLGVRFTPMRDQVTGGYRRALWVLLGAAPSFDICIPLRQTHEDTVAWLQNIQYWVVRTDDEPLLLANAFREQVRKVDGDVAASNVRSMHQYLSLTIAPRRFNLQLLAVFAFAALALAPGGISAVISNSVNQRAHEISVRMAIGAQPSDVLRMVIRDGMKPVLAGLVLGLVSVFALGRVLASLLFEVSASDPATLVWVTLSFCGVSLAAILVPARRAANIDSLAVLRDG